MYVSKRERAREREGEREREREREAEKQRERRREAEIGGESACSEAKDTLSRSLIEQRDT